MAHRKWLRDGLTTGAVALVLVLGGVTACSAGGPPAGESAPLSSDTAPNDPSDSPSPSPSPTEAAAVVVATHAGESSEQASGELTQQGLLISFADAAGHVLPSEQGWFVVDVRPPAGTSVARGSMVTLVLSAPVVTADHVGQTSDQAITELTQQGLLVSFADASGNVLPSEEGWSVVGQNPAGGASLRAGSMVQLILSPPPPPPPPSDSGSGSGSGSGSEQPVTGGGATALCNDGTLSYSAHHQGTCSHHGGVAVWYK